VNGHFSLLTWGMAATALLIVGLSLALGSGNAQRRAAGSGLLKLSLLFLAGWGWAAVHPGPYGVIPSSLAAFLVLLLYSLSTFAAEAVWSLSLDEEAAPPEPERRLPTRRKP